MNETQRFVIVWNDHGTPKSFVFHDVTDGNSDDLSAEHAPILAYQRAQLRATDRIVTDVLEAELSFTAATAQEPIAIPVSLARDLAWFPGARYVEFEMV